MHKHRIHKNRRTQAGFTLIELMIVIAIIGILASVALPAYQTFVKKAKFSEVVMAVSMVKSAVNVCYAIRGAGDLAKCDTEAEIGMYLSDAENGPMVNKVTLGTTTAVITGTGEAAVDGQTFILTPTGDGRNLTWAQTGSCIASGLC